MGGRGFGLSHKMIQAGNPLGTGMSYRPQTGRLVRDHSIARFVLKILLSVCQKLPAPTTATDRPESHNQGSTRVSPGCDLYIHSAALSSSDHAAQNICHTRYINSLLLRQYSVRGPWSVVIGLRAPGERFQRVHSEKKKACVWCCRADSRSLLPPREDGP
jgi:hypothetical protein